VFKGYEIWNYKKRKKEPKLIEESFFSPELARLAELYHIFRVPSSDI
jgi:hypothetical protein